MPTTSFYIELQNAIMNKAYMKIIQFFHIALSKIIELTILAQIAGIILEAVGIVNKKDEDNKQEEA
ncbi:hypothetical protein D3C75_806960 [compost metagenome]